MSKAKGLATQEFEQEVVQGQEVAVYDTMGGLSIKQAVKNMIANKADMDQFIKGVMVEGEDFGVIPGTKNKTLLKPGAEKLCQLLGLTVTFKALEVLREPNAMEPELIFYRYRCTLIRADGSVASEGEATASSGERVHCRESSKWVYENKATEAEKSMGTRVQKKSQKGGTYWVYEIKSDINPADMENTICKKAQKRAHMAATLTAGRLSCSFTQDVEEDPAMYDMQEIPHDQQSQGPPDNQAPATQQQPAQQKKGRGRPPGTGKNQQQQAAPAQQQAPAPQQQAPPPQNSPAAAAATQGNAAGQGADPVVETLGNPEQIHANVIQMIDECDTLEKLHKVAVDLKPTIDALPHLAKEACIKRGKIKKHLLENPPAPPAQEDAGAF